ncbi:diguanylate cyclase [Candidatus Woesearchaeota archaeon]|nr:diguanylate cyclase [Candidatus Woesearchaeota archaeon]
MAAEFIDFIKKTIFLQDKEYLLIRDFEYRWKLFLRHEKLGLLLVDKTEAFITYPKESLVLEIRSLAIDVEKHLTLSLRYVSEADVDSVNIDRVVSDETADWDAAIKMLEKDVLEIRRNADLLPEGQTKRALVIALDDLDKERDISSKETKLNLFVRKIIVELREIIQEERQILEKEIAILQQVYRFDATVIIERKENSENLVEHIKEGNTHFREGIRALRELFLKERGRVINPYTALMDQKSIVLKTLERHATKEVVTAKMIHYDLGQLTAPQAERYLGLLEGKLANLEDNSAKFYLRFKSFFTRKRDRRKYAKEDTLAATVDEMKARLHFDPLMGVGNKEYLPIALSEKIESVSRLGGIVALLYLDLDKFKLVNDTYGHPMGDEILKAAGKVARQSVAPGDIICRIGGEELSVIFSQVISFSQAQDRAEIIRANIAKECPEIILSLQKATGSLKLLQKDLKSGERTITISGGLACMEVPQLLLVEKSIDAIASMLIGLADQKLYTAKEAGRNRIHMGSLKYSPDKKI